MWPGMRVRYSQNRDVRPVAVAASPITERLKRLLKPVRGSRQDDFHRGSASRRRGQSAEEVSDSYVVNERNRDPDPAGELAGKLPLKANCSGSAAPSAKS